MSIQSNLSTTRQYTKAEWDEILKCRKDFGYFAGKYLKIIHPKKGLINFKLYDFQKKVVGDFEDYNYNIVKKFRQAGLTTVASLWLLWKCLFYTDQRCMILSKSDREAKAVGKTVAAAKKELPPFLQPIMNNDNDHEKEFLETGSAMWFFTPSAARSRALTYLVIDEAAFIPQMDEHWKAMYPTLSTGGNCIVISTVHGIGNWYEETYTNARDKKNQFHVINLDWREHPDYNNPDWEKRTRANVGPKGFAQEYDGSFLGSGETYIPGEMILELERDVVDPTFKALAEWDTIPEESFEEHLMPSKIYEPGALWVWEKAKTGREYIIAADASEGVGEEGDFCAFVVLDVNNLTQVAEFYSNTIPPYKFAQVLKQTGELYNTALIVVENSMGPGQAVCDRLQHTLSYENMYFTQNVSRDRIGVNMTKNVRPVICEAMQMCILNRLVKIRSIRIVRELKVFIYNKAKQRAEAQKNKHDDLVISLAIALHVCDAINREMPIMTNGKHEMDLITQTMFNEDFQKLREELELGISEDILDEDVDIEFELLPKVMFDVPKRPYDKLLKEFNF